MKLVIRNDDINYLTNVDDLKYLIDLSMVFQQTYSIIPFCNIGSMTKAIWENESPIKHILDNQIEYSIHGIFHTNNKGRYEFSFFSEEEKRKKIEFFEKIKKSELNTHIFVPPHNYLDLKWCHTLKTFGYNIISGTKRQFYNKKKENCRTGTINQNGIFYIPQTLMIRKKDYKYFQDYFEKLYCLIGKSLNILDTLVITIHGYELLEEKKYYLEVKEFLRKIEKLGVISTSFGECVNDEEKEIAQDFFYEVRADE